MLLAAAVAAAAAALLGCDNSAVTGPMHDDGEPLTITPTPKPRLVVMLVVDQLPSWSFDIEQEMMTKGMRRLIDNGVYFPRAEFPYAITFTAPGHTTLGTGAPPSVSGILANGWFRPEENRLAAAISDESSPVFRLAGEPAPDEKPRGASAGQLEVDGIADALHLAHPDARAVSIALKSRAAIFALGRKPDIAVWYESGQPAMTTSKYYGDAPPQWLTDLAKTNPIADRLPGYVWHPRNEVRLGWRTMAPDHQHGEGGDYGMGIEFPHALADSEVPASALKTTPLGDDLVLETAMAAIEGENLGADDVPDLLSVSFSAHDYAGHAWGHESWERLELLFRLDETIGKLLDFLDARLGPDGYAVVLSSDHGATRLIERTVASGGYARRVYNREIKAAAESAATATLGKSAEPWINVVTGSSIYMSAKLLALAEPRRTEALEAIVGAVVAIKGIAYAARTDRIAKDCDTRKGTDYYACNSVMPERSGQVFFAPDPDCLLTSSYTTGTSHGSANDDDRIVPIVVYAAGLPARRVDEQMSTLQVTPTLAGLLGIDPPDTAKAPPLPLR
jgi:predicted AlkP superfamily pyrophosphatase or phosphodiesterase